MKLLSRADVVIALGSRLGPFGTLPQHGMDYWPKDAKIIQIDADHKMLGLVKKISVGICGDAKAAAVALTQRLANRELACDATRNERADQIASEKAAWEKELDGWTHELDSYSLDMIEENKHERTFNGGHYLHPRQVLRELEKAMPEDVMVSTDIGNINSVANSYLRFNKPRSFFAAMSWGNCGYASDDHRRQSRGAAPPGRLIRRRRRLGHEPHGNDDLRAARHCRHRRRVP
jgi:sulfoacetaldehyde acetyltransferase